MAKIELAGEIRIIPIEQIDVLNTRERNSKVFEEVVNNIKTLGLKKPITVTPRKGPNDEDRFLLICGEGRLKAFKALEATTIPARVIIVSDEQAFIMSLVENIARSKRDALEMVREIGRLRDKGYNPKEIGEKVELGTSYVNGVLTLLQKGEEKLLIAVERKQISIAAAMTIVNAGEDDKAIQNALQEAYESGQLRGGKLKCVRKLIDKRKAKGQPIIKPKDGEKGITSSSLVRAFQQEVDRKRLMVKKAGYVEQRLLFIVGAFRDLYGDENFTNLLLAQKMETMPKGLSDRVWSESRPA
jgi:ParB family chromosome partitioning protein